MTDPLYDDNAMALRDAFRDETDTETRARLRQRHEAQPGTLDAIKAAVRSVLPMGIVAEFREFQDPSVPVGTVRIQISEHRPPHASVDMVIDRESWDVFSELINRSHRVIESEVLVEIKDGQMRALTDSKPKLIETTGQMIGACDHCKKRAPLFLVPRGELLEPYLCEDCAKARDKETRE